MWACFYAVLWDLMYWVILIISNGLKWKLKKIRYFLFLWILCFIYKIENSWGKLTGKLGKRLWSSTNYLMPQYLW